MINNMTELDNINYTQGPRLKVKSMKKEKIIGIARKKTSHHTWGQLKT